MVVKLLASAGSVARNALMRNVAPVIVLVVVAALASLLWWMQSTADRPGRRGPPDAGLARRASLEPLPAFDAGVPRPRDAAVPDAAIDRNYAVEHGALGLPVSLLEAPFVTPAAATWWARDTKGPGPAWVNKRDVKVTFEVAGNRAVGARLDFPKTAGTADLQAISPQLVGLRTPLAPPGYEQADRSKGTLRSGSFETENGRTIHYRGEVTFDDGAGRPLWFEYRAVPFGTAPAAP